MKRKIKLLSLVLLLISTILTGCADKELIASQINEAISFSGSLDDYKNTDLETRKSSCDQKHIEVSGIATDVGYSLLIIGDDKKYGMEFSCTFENEIEGIEEGDNVKVHGVCDGCYDDTMYLYGCELVEIIETELTEESTLETSSESEPLETSEATSSIEQSIEESTQEATSASTQENTEIPIIESKTPEDTAKTMNVVALSSIPAYSGKPYVAINENTPTFTDDELSTSSYEYYSNLDSKGRCGICVASIGTDIMPTEERGAIGDVKPSGWNQKKYNGLVEGNYLYNRCHLIGYQLTGENANTKNLITGTRYMNVEGMLPFENMIADYVKETNNHVMLRVTPIFDGNNLLANGVHMEAQSVEDKGDGISFNVFCYNVQPGVIIDYSNGANEAEVKATPEPTPKPTPEPAPEPTPEPAPEPAPEQPATGGTCWKSETGSKYHSINNCGRMNPNKATQITIEQAINMGLSQCSKCY